MSIEILNSFLNTQHFFTLHYPLPITHYPLPVPLDVTGRGGITHPLRGTEKYAS